MNSSSSASPLFREKPQQKDQDDPYLDESLRHDELIVFRLFSPKESDDEGHEKEDRGAHDRPEPHDKGEHTSVVDGETVLLGAGGAVVGDERAVDDIEARGSVGNVGAFWEIRKSGVHPAKMDFSADIKSVQIKSLLIPSTTKNPIKIRQLAVRRGREREEA
eukprot:CAMPEP_0194345594 /NCGR_PEP_ID=MMETSP0171-20130528/104946_1 /TAXON_ID=218684 /ORGANISM="Corethron pennatum, Strain L29A3" /LENGTH=161 /DNA_ID=CAMNT_0039112601 /DNA_START=926 /DNA_END=1413 /DNA_ORIENTATION=+